MPPKPPASRFFSGLMGFASSAMVRPSASPAVCVYLFRTGPAPQPQPHAGSADLPPTFGWAGQEPGTGWEEGPGCRVGFRWGARLPVEAPPPTGGVRGSGAGSHILWAVFGRAAVRWAPPGSLPGLECFLLWAPIPPVTRLRPTALRYVPAALPGAGGTHGSPAHESLSLWSLQSITKISK